MSLTIVVSRTKPEAKALARRLGVPVKRAYRHWRLSSILPASRAV
ncbi:hypothetical protein PBI_GAIA_178 [Mycobacterium phage Gaia]|uniref:Uncharacterized protein n=1 Tax=Mycobacterium phage Gaia TaxID=1486472 RepID=A0A068F2N5_9CAUD|nr:hypothetical protein VC46_gp058 [Mycobacterium phage Gaia]AID58994.1 hypothetical protein PBI_GAIA_178 [Mycobacterium phage Gaia]